jgi:hypothetical protein
MVGQAVTQQQARVNGFETREKEGPQRGGDHKRHRRTGACPVEHLGAQTSASQLGDMCKGDHERLHNGGSGERKAKFATSNQQNERAEFHFAQIHAPLWQSDDRSDRDHRLALFTAAATLPACQGRNGRATLHS